jgi:hypothetical protein
MVIENGTAGLEGLESAFVRHAVVVVGCKTSANFIG